jgi:hypothetical protein
MTAWARITNRGLLSTGGALARRTYHRGYGRTRRALWFASSPVVPTLPDADHSTPGPGVRAVLGLAGRSRGAAASAISRPGPRTRRTCGRRLAAACCVARLLARFAASDCTEARRATRPPSPCRLCGRSTMRQPCRRCASERRPTHPRGGTGRRAFARRRLVPSTRFLAFCTHPKPRSADHATRF